MATLATLRQAVKDIVIPEGNSPYSDSFYDLRINDAILNIASQVVIPELSVVDDTAFSLVAGTRTYSFANFDPPVHWIRSIKNVTNDRVLHYITRKEADEYDETETGEPLFYTREGFGIEVYPLPSSTYHGSVLRMRYQKTPTALTSDGDQSPLSPYLDRAIIQLAAAYVFHDQQQPGRAAQALAMFKGIMNTYKEPSEFEYEYSDTVLFPPRRTT